MRTQHFYQLTRVAQDRFIDAVLRRTVPTPIISQRSMAPVPWPWLVASLASFVGFCVAVAWGYGDLQSDVALAPQWLTGVYALLLSTAIYTGLQAIARLLQARRAPFPYGKYAFPAAVIDASTPVFKIYPTSELTDVTVAGSRNVVLRFQSGDSLRFKARDAQAADKAKHRLLSAKTQLLESPLEDDGLAKLDPLTEPRLSNPLAPLAAHAPAVPSWRKFTPALALVAGAGLAALSGYVRNTLSERRMFAVAVETNTPASYRAYMARGGQRPDVPTLRLPSAELEALTAKGSLAQLEEYAQLHPDSKIRPAIDSALRQALLAALEEAKKKGTFQALEAFAQNHPSQKLVQEEVKAARKALMKRVLSNFADNYAADDPELVPFMEKLLEYLAAHGPNVEVRFHRIVPESVERADEIVKRDKYYIRSMLPSQYFDDEPAQKREEQIFEHLSARFEQAFNPDALRLTHGKHLGTAEKLPEEPSVPSLFITHSTNMGHGIRNVKPNGTFVGVGFVFKAFFVIPGEEQMLSTKYSTWRLPDLLKLRNGKLTVPQVYTTMAEDAFEKFDRRLVAWLFRER